MSYNMYLANTLALLAKRLCEDPDMVNEALSTVIKAKSSEAMDKGLSSMGIHIKQLEEDSKVREILEYDEKCDRYLCSNIISFDF